MKNNTIHDLIKFENNVQLIFNSESCHYSNWVVTNETTSKKRKSDLCYDMIENINPNSYHQKYYTPYSLLNQSEDEEDEDDEENYEYNLNETCYKETQLLKEMGKVREDIVRFKSKMNGLAKQINGIELDLIHSKDRVYEIEKGLTATQEVNVNLQVLLEKAVNNQKESDVYATRMMKHVHSNLTNIVYDTGKLNGRLTSIAKHQKQQQGSVKDIVERMKEYTHMLEQAQGTIKYLNKPHRKEKTQTVATTTSSENRINKLDLYRHRIIRKRSIDPSATSLPQKGLRILLTDYRGF